ncbi:MAG: hypothetical protein WDM79_00570 [Terricaulis sp.]
MAGYVGVRAAWSELEEQWSREVLAWRIDRFHRAEMKHLLGRERGELCIRAFAQLIRASSLINVWSAVVDHDWEKLAKPRAFSARFPTTRHFCFEHVLSQLSVWAKEEKQNAPFEIVFDNDMERTASEAIYAEYQGARTHPNFSCPLKWADSGRFPMIEAADLAAGELQVYWLAFEPTWTYHKAPPQFGAALGGKGLSECGLWASESLPVAVADFHANGDAFSLRSATGGLIIPV